MTNIMNKKGITINSANIKRIIKNKSANKYYEQLYARNMMIQMTL